MVSEANDVVSPKTFQPPITTTMLTSGGLIISTTDPIRSFFTAAASTDPHLSEDLKNLASSLSLHSTVPYSSLKAIWFGSERETRPSLSSLLSGCEFIFTSPKPREKVILIIIRKLVKFQRRVAKIS